MSVADIDLHIVVEESFRLATGEGPVSRQKEIEFLVACLKGSRQARKEYVDSGFPESVVIATAIRRRQGAAPTLALVPSAEINVFNATVSRWLERLGLRLGFDLIVYGVPELDGLQPDINAEGELDIDLDALFDGKAEQEPVPRDHPWDVWNDVNRLEPGLLALLGQTSHGKPGTLPLHIETWICNLPGNVPVLRGWESKAAATDVPNVTIRPTQPPVIPAQRIRRPAESREIASQLLRRRAVIVSITGRPGSGRTSLIAEVAAQLQASGQPMTLRHFDDRGDERVDSLQNRFEYIVSNEARIPEVVAIDDFDVLCQLGKKGSADRDLLNRISQVADLEIIRFLIVLDERNLDALAELDHDFAERIVHVRLNELPHHDLKEIIRDEIGAHADAAGFVLDDSVMATALSPTAGDEVRRQPGLGIDRVEAAIARARQRRGTSLTASDFSALTQPRSTAPTADELETQLHAHVKGQDRVLRIIAERLTPALAGLKLRPERPHGVLFFAGPSGVGKTETAKHLADTVYGSSEALIRLDMSEYANEDDARMKLIGASRIWKNSSTDGLLTTEVIEKPRSAILLDEFEKSHPSVWNVFLQVFDEGKLTDGWGRVASFAETIIIITSNLGVREGSTRSAGFGETEAFDPSRQDVAISKALPPELQGRLTATVHFDPLTADALRELARMELERACTRFRQQG